MEISKEEAANSLDQISEVRNRTRRITASKYESSGLMLWGCILIIAYIATHFFLNWAWLIWMALGTLGGFAMFLMCRRQLRLGDPVRMPSADKVGWRIFWFWFSLYGYISLWLILLRPFNGIQMNAFILTAIMYAYVIMGLWFGGSQMIIIGLAVTCSTMVGYFLIPPQYYCLWMAPTSGGILLASGFYLRFRWG